MPMGFISLKMNIIVLGKNLYWRKTSSVSKSSKGLNRSQKWQGLLATADVLHGQPSLVLEQGSETASVLAQEITVYAQRCTQAEHENILKSFITLVLCSDSEKSEFVLKKCYNLRARNTRLKILHRLLLALLLSDGYFSRFPLVQTAWLHLKNWTSTRSYYKWAVTCGFQQCGILTSQCRLRRAWQPPFKLKISKWC